MTRRARVIFLSTLLVIVGGVVVVVGGIAVLLESDWGHRRIREVIEQQADASLAAGVRLHIGRLDGGPAGPWELSQVALTDTHGATVFGATRVRAGIHLAELARGVLHLSLVEVDGAQVDLVRNGNGAWNVAALAATPSATPAPRQPSAGNAGWRIVVDSVEVRDSRVNLTMPDTSPVLPPVRRHVRALHLALGTTTVEPPRTRDGGATTVRALSFALDTPDVNVVAMRGDVRWWPDSLRLDVPALRLPRSVASARGTVNWRSPDTLRVSMDVRADTVDLGDVHKLVPQVPAEGTARAVVAVRTDPDGAIGYDVSALDVRSGGSHVAGAGRVTPGPRMQVRNVALRLEPLDLRLVRELAGDSTLAPAWQGVVTGRLAASGGFLDSLVIDTVAATFDDARTGGARSRITGGGAIDLSAKPVRLIGVRAAADSLVIRTLGAAAPAADSIPGVLVGSVTLDGTLRDLQFSDLRVRHVDSGAVSVAITGTGHVSPDRQGHWLDGEFTIDTVSIATLARGRTNLPLHGTPHGTVTVHAINDTLALSTSLVDGEAAVQVSGTTLLDSLRTSAELSGTVQNLDPHMFLARADIPAAHLSGRARISVDDTPSSTERHVELFLDSTSTLGDSHLSMADVRVGIDSAGFHVDTAEVHADTWHLSARGRLARDSARSDTLWFDGTVDSLSALRSIVLDSAGGPRFPDLAGRLVVDSGRVVGSFADAGLFAALSATDVRLGTDTVASAAGVVDLEHLPGHATGTVRGLVTGIASGAVSFDTTEVVARVADGTHAGLDVRAVTRDSVTLTATGDVTWPDSGYAARIDSLRASAGEHWWRLGAPARLAFRSGTLTVDSARFVSDSGAIAVAAAEVPDNGAIRGALRVEHLGFDELAFLQVLPADLSGFIAADATLAGTRDAPVIRAHATLDDIKSDDRERPSFSFDLQYADRKATVAAVATISGRRALDARGDIPLNLAFDVADSSRIIDAPISLHLVADSATLAAFDALTPNLRGLAGYVNGTIDVGGTLRRPRGTGTLTLADGAFNLQRYGFQARRSVADLRLAGDSIIIRRLRVGDADSQRDSATLTGVVRLSGNHWSEWQADLTSVASNFRVLDDARLATTKANWNLAVEGALREPRVTGDVVLPYGVFTIGPQRRQRSTITDSTATAPVGTPDLDGVLVTLGSDVRLKSHDANVQLAGSVELFGPLNRPWISGSVQATRGTYRVDLGLLKRTFRVDSGAVVLEGTPDVPPALDIRASYIVRQPDADDITVGAHVYGTTDRPRLDLSSDLGSATSQSEIISYLVFGKPSFAVPANQGAVAQTAYNAVVPSILGGYLESLLSSVLPFFNSLQVTTVGREDRNLLSISTITNPVENLFNSFAVTGGRQVGTDSFLSVTTGVCTSNSVATTSNSPIWFGTSAEYRPKRSVGAAISIDPGPAPCSPVVSATREYQLGLDLLYAWPFGKP